MDSDNESENKTAAPKEARPTFKRNQRTINVVRITPAVTSLIERHSIRLTAPAPRQDTHPVALPTADYIPWAASLYESIVNAIYSGYPVPVDVIQQNAFVSAVLILIFEKTLLVHAYVANTREAFRPRYLNRTLMPTSLVYVLNGLGLHMIKNGAYQIYPEPDPTVTPAYYDATYAVGIDQTFIDFNKLINNATIKGCCTSAYAGTETQGNASWCLKAINANTEAIANGNIQAVTIQSIFTEATCDDVLIATIVQNQFPGLTVDANVEMTYQWKTTNGMFGLREYFNTHA